MTTDTPLSIAEIERLRNSPSAWGGYQCLHPEKMNALCDMASAYLTTARREEAAPELAEGEVEGLRTEAKAFATAQAPQVAGFARDVLKLLARQQAEIARLAAVSREYRDKLAEVIKEGGSKIDALKRVVEEARRYTRPVFAGAPDGSAENRLCVIDTILHAALTAVQGEGEAPSTFDFTVPDGELGSPAAAIKRPSAPSSEGHSAGEGGEYRGRPLAEHDVLDALNIPMFGMATDEYDKLSVNSAVIASRRAIRNLPTAATLRPDLLREAMEALEAAAIRFKLLALNRQRTDVDPAVGAEEASSIHAKLKTATGVPHD